MRAPTFGIVALWSLLCIGVTAYVLVALEFQWFERPAPFRDPVLQRADEDRILARVDRYPILYSQLYAEASSKGLTGSNGSLELEDKDVKRLLEELIDQRVLANEARRVGIDEDRSSQPRLALARDRTLSEILLRRLIESGVTEQSLRDVYDSQIDALQLNEEVRARHILVDDEEEAGTIARQIAAGADFGSLARRYSTDEATAAKDGDLGYFTRADMVKPFSDVAFSTPVGKVSAPFQTQFGWHILKVEDRRQRNPPSFEELRAEIVRYRTFEVVRKEIERLRKDASIDYVQVTPPPPE